MAVTTIDGVNKIQIRNAKNGDFDLNLAGGGGGTPEEMMEVWLTKGMVGNQETVTLTDFDDKGITLNSQTNGFNVKVHFNDFGYEYELVCGGYILDTDFDGTLFYVPLMYWGSVKIEFGESTSATLVSGDKINLVISGSGTFGAGSVSFHETSYSIEGIFAYRIKGDIANYRSNFSTPLKAFFGVDLNNLLIINTDTQTYTANDGLAIGSLSNQTE